MTLAGWLDDWTEQALLCGEIAPGDLPGGRLSSAQERLLWEQAIDSTLHDLDSEPLFDKAGLASAAQEANRLLTEWPIDLAAAGGAEETQQFLLWRERFQALCRQHDRLESARYFRWQLECLESGAGELPPAFTLAGFDRPSPLQKRLFAALEARGARVTPALTLCAEPGQACRIELDDQDAECRAAVGWVQQQLIQNPAARLAIVVPELSALRDKLAALLDEALHPAWVTPRLAQTPRTYDFSLGTPLAGQPVIATALQLLRCGFQRQALTQAEISELLLSPYWSAASSEADARAQLDARMREWLPLTLGAQRLQHFVQKALSDKRPLSLTGLHQDLRQLLSQCQQLPRQQLPSQWVAAFRLILQQPCWPGERPLSSHEHQARQVFEEVLTALADLDPLSGKMTALQAVQRLSQLCREQVFQPEARELPQLQVLGMLETVGEPLDGIWVLGMNDHIWPPAPAPNPLLPARLQRQAATPNADSRVQMEFAAVIQRRLLISARQVFFSWARQEGERQLRVSPLLQELPVAAAPASLFSTLAETLALRAPECMHALLDVRAPAVGVDEEVSGGTGLLRAQAICPAWAFYQYRLHVRPLRQPVTGLDAMERGTLVHGVLERFWQERTLHDLLVMPMEALVNVIAEAARQTLEAFNGARDEPLSQAFIDLEQTRLGKLVLAWLRDVEMKRPMDFAVTARERMTHVVIAGMKIQLVVDRIDTLEDGKLVLLDYKTGRNNDYKNWADARISEPQLPIYAAFVVGEQEEVAAVCYAQVRMDGNALRGVACASDRVQGALVLNDHRARKIFAEEDFPDWPALLRHWRTSVENVAGELKSGEAAVRFVDEKQLAYCEVLPLLRLPERQLQFERPELLAGMDEVST